MKLLHALADRYGTGEGGLDWFELDLANRRQRPIRSF
jgi:hypothetical protein